MKRGLVFATLFLVVLIVSSGTTNRSAQAAPTSLVLTVNINVDLPDATPGNGVCETALNNHVCTLRGAIQEANAHTGADAINLSGITYLLSRIGDDNTALNGDLDITDTVTINGMGANSTSIDGNQIDRVFQITGTVVISGVTIRNGKVSSINPFGAGILNYGMLTLFNSTVISNTINGAGGNYGGGIHNGFGAKLTLINSAVMSNTAGAGGATALGGGIMNDGGTLTLINNTVSGNTTPGDGGGIYTVGTMTITNSTISRNSARNGGGIYKAGAPMIVINSTLSGNYSTGNGGGIYNSSNTTSLFNVTIAYNLANADGSGSGIGGGVTNAGGTLNFINSIMALNANIFDTGGLFDILQDDDCSGTITSQGYNILYHSDSIYCNVVGSFTLTDPQLGLLQNNGGPTPTHALLSDSPARDAGNPGGCTDNLGAPLTTDQRSFHRPFGIRCDIGAFEYQGKIFLPLVKK